MIINYKLLCQVKQEERIELPGDNVSSTFVLPFLTSNCVMITKNLRTEDSSKVSNISVLYLSNVIN